MQRNTLRKGDPQHVCNNILEHDSFFFSTKCLQHECPEKWGFSRASFTRRVGRSLSTRRTSTITIRSICFHVVALRHAVNISEASTPICLCMRPHANNCPPVRPCGQTFRGNLSCYFVRYFVEHGHTNNERIMKHQPDPRLSTKPQRISTTT